MKLRRQGDRFGEPARTGVSPFAAELITRDAISPEFAS
jgi:hypothetical protein